MASTCIRTQPTYGQNIHIMPTPTQNYLILSSQNLVNQPTVVNQFINVHHPGKTPIAPAPSSNSSNNNNSNNNNRSNSQNSILGMNGSNIKLVDGNRYKKKYTYANMPYGEQPPSVARRNARERNRVKQVNNGFAKLRLHIPSNIVTALGSGGRGASKKLSKVETLRMTIEYIHYLEDVLYDADSDASSTSTVNCQNSPVPLSASPSATSQTSSYFPDSPSPHYSLQDPCSEASVSPAPSLDDSEISIGNSGGSGSYNNQQSSTPFKYEQQYDSYEQTRPSDEEILDYIQYWQEQ